MDQHPWLVSRLCTTVQAGLNPVACFLEMLQYIHERVVVDFEGFDLDLAVRTFESWIQGSRSLVSLQNRKYSNHIVHFELLLGRRCEATSLLPLSRYIKIKTMRLCGTYSDINKPGIAWIGTRVGVGSSSMLINWFYFEVISRTLELDVDVLYICLYCQVNILFQPPVNDWHLL